jgi:hypothetical protein
MGIGLGGMGDDTGALACSGGCRNPNAASDLAGAAALLGVTSALLPPGCVGAGVPAPPPPPPLLDTPRAASSSAMNGPTPANASHTSRVSATLSPPAADLADRPDGSDLPGFMRRCAMLVAARFSASPGVAGGGGIAQGGFQVGHDLTHGGRITAQLPRFGRQQVYRSGQGQIQVHGAVR